LDGETITAIDSQAEHPFEERQLAEPQDSERRPLVVAPEVQQLSKHYHNGNDPAGNRVAER
jgi:hypothetical protein